MAQSDDLTTYAQTWRDDGQGQYNPEHAAYYGDENSRPAQQQAYPPNAALAEQPQPAHNAGFQNPYDAQPALPPTSHDAAPAGQQYHQQAQPVTYQADPLTHPPTQPHEAQPGPAPQAYAEAPPAFGQAQPAAGDHYAAQAQTQPGHEQAAVVYTNYTAPPRRPLRRLIIIRFNQIRTLSRRVARPPTTHHCSTTVQAPDLPSSAIRHSPTPKPAWASRPLTSRNRFRISRKLRRTIPMRFRKVEMIIPQRILPRRVCITSRRLVEPFSIQPYFRNRRPTIRLIRMLLRFPYSRPARHP